MVICRSRVAGESGKEGLNIDVQIKNHFLPETYSTASKETSKSEMRDKQQTRKLSPFCSLLHHRHLCCQEVAKAFPVRDRPEGKSVPGFCPCLPAHLHARCSKGSRKPPVQPTEDTAGQGRVAYSGIIFCIMNSTIVGTACICRARAETFQPLGMNREKKERNEQTRVPNVSVYKRFPHAWRGMRGESSSVLAALLR